MLRQNEEIDRLGLPRIEDETQLEELKTNLELVELTDTKSMRVDPRLDPALRYANPGHAILSTTSAPHITNSSRPRFKSTPLSALSSIKSNCADTIRTRRQKLATPLPHTWPA